MKNWDITIKATVTKTIRVKAKSEDEAIKQAHEEFTVACDRNDEDYEQDTVSSVLVKKG